MSPVSFGSGIYCILVSGTPPLDPFINLPLIMLSLFSITSPNELSSYPGFVIDSTFLPPPFQVPYNPLLVHTIPRLRPLYSGIFPKSEMRLIPLFYNPLKLVFFLHLTIHHCYIDYLHNSHVRLSGSTFLRHVNVQIT